MDEATAQAYRQCAMARLERAQELYRSIGPETRQPAFCELAQVSSLIWDAVIDALATVYMDRGGAPSGNSVELRGYAKSELPDVYRYWSGPGRLHNFQHRPYQDVDLFHEGCLLTARLFLQVNTHLPEPLRLPADRFGWLSR